MIDAKFISSLIVKETKCKDALEMGLGCGPFCNAMKELKVFTHAAGSAFDSKKFTGTIHKHDLVTRLSIGRGYDVVILSECNDHRWIANAVLHARRFVVVVGYAPNIESNLAKHLELAGMDRRKGIEDKWIKAIKDAKKNAPKLFVFEKVKLSINSSEWWDRKGTEYTLAGDDRVRPEEMVEAAKYCKWPVLEIGPAFGDFCQFMPANGQYVGIEISAYLLEKAQSKFPSCVFIGGDFLKLGVNWHNAFETIAAFQVIEHFPRIDEFMVQSKKIARSSLVFSVPRGETNELSKKNDGHFNGWKDEAAIIKDFGRFGKVTIWAGAENHLCGVVQW